MKLKRFRQSLLLAAFISLFMYLFTYGNSGMTENMINDVIRKLNNLDVLVCIYAYICWVKYAENGFVFNECVPTF